MARRLRQRIQVHFQTRQKHQPDKAELGQKTQNGRFFNEVQAALPYHHSGQDLAHDNGHGQHSRDLTNEQRYGHGE